MLQLYGMNQKTEGDIKQMGLLQKIKENKMGELMNAQVAATNIRKDLCWCWLVQGQEKLQY